MQSEGELRLVGKHIREEFEEWRTDSLGLLWKAC